MYIFGHLLIIAISLLYAVYQSVRFDWELHALVKKLEKEERHGPRNLV